MRSVKKKAGSTIIHPVAQGHRIGLIATTVHRLIPPPFLRLPLLPFRVAVAAAVAAVAVVVRRVQAVSRHWSHGCGDTTWSRSTTIRNWTSGTTYVSAPIITATMMLVNRLDRVMRSTATAPA